MIRVSYNTLLDRIFDEYGLIVCGWSGEWDEALRNAILRAPNRRYPAYWAAKGDLSGAAQDLVQKRDARILPIEDADGFFTTLSDRIATLEQTQARNPGSVDLLVQSAKRFVVRPEHRIQLSDLVSNEIEKVTMRLDASDLSPQSDWSEVEFRRRVMVYEASTEGLAKIMGVLGRWSNDENSGLAKEAIDALLAHADNHQGGNIYHLRIRSYPAVLVFTAFGIGLVRAEQWRRLHQLFYTNVAHQQSGSQSMLERLFLGSWEGGYHDLWNDLKDDYRNLKTPLSNHLYEDIFLHWTKPFFGSMHDFEEAFELFEVLASISSLDSIEKDELVRELKGNLYSPIPIGRTCWHGQMRKRLLTRITSEPLSKSLLTAGFAKGDPEFLELVIKNYNRVVSRIQNLGR